MNVFLECAMRLNLASDFALRIVMQLASETEAITIDALAQRLGLVKSHVMKICAKLVQANIVSARRGRSGGIHLAREPEQITVGEVVRVIENDFAVVECMKDEPSQCTFLPGCRLRHSIHEATKAFLAVLDQQTIADITLAQSHSSPI